MAICWLARQNLVTQNIKHIYDATSAGRQYRTLIAHISQGPSNASTRNWFETYPKVINGTELPENQQFAGAHFGIEKDGRVEQFVDTQYICWGAGSANIHAIHVEHVGRSGDALSDDQVEMLGNLLAWCNQIHNMEIALNFMGPTYTSPDQLRSGVKPSSYPAINSGLGFHAQYGGHPSCPGPTIIGQLPTVVGIAQDIAAGTRAWRLH